MGEAEKKYKEKMAKEGFRQVNVWAKIEDAEKIKTFAKNLLEVQKVQKETTQKKLFEWKIGKFFITISESEF